MPQASRTRSMTSGFSGSPAPTISRSVGTPGAKVLEDEHPPHGRRRAERGHAVRNERVEHARGVEARVVEDEDRGARVPRREEAAPGVLRPARRADVPVHVAFTQSDPVHRREVADRIAHVRVQHHLRLRRRAGREVEEKRVVAARLPIGLEIADAIGGIGDPPRARQADDDAREVTRDLVELRRRPRRR